MKKTLLVVSLLVIVSLVGCNFNVPSLSGTNKGVEATDDLIQTQVVEMLTSIPTNTPAAPEATPTVELATLAVDTPAVPAPTETPIELTPTLAPAATQTPVEPTSTSEAAATETPAATATLPAAPTATLNPSDPRSRLGAPASTDPMDDPNTWIWPVGSDDYTTAEFSGGSMVLNLKSDMPGWRMANPLGSEFKNIYLEATVSTTECKGADNYGLIVRVPVLSTPNQGYLFGLTCDGRYSLRRWDSTVPPKGEMRYLVDWTASPAIAAGANKTNTMGIMVSGSRILLYANGTFLTEVSDAKFASGYFGVFIGPDPAQVTKGLKVRIDSMSYWNNPQP